MTRTPCFLAWALATLLGCTGSGGTEPEQQAADQFGVARSEDFSAEGCDNSTEPVETFIDDELSPHTISKVGPDVSYCMASEPEGRFAVWVTLKAGRETWKAGVPFTGELEHEIRRCAVAQVLAGDGIVTSFGFQASFDAELAADRIMALAARADVENVSLLAGYYDYRTSRSIPFDRRCEEARR